MSAALAQGRGEGRRFELGQSGNPGGMPKGLRQLQATIKLAHGGKILTALQKLFEMGMDERTYIGMTKQGTEVEIPVVEAGVRAKCLTAFVDKVGLLTGLESVARAPGEEKAPENEAELIERVAERLLEKPETRAMVEAKLQVIQGGKP